MYCCEKQSRCYVKSTYCDAWHTVSQHNKGRSLEDLYYRRITEGGRGLTNAFLIPDSPKPLFFLTLIPLD